MPYCPDCGNPMKKDKLFFVCEACGLSFKPWEIEKMTGNKRKRQFKRAEEAEASLDDEQKNRRRQKDYLDWYLKKA